jgi:hypothetical protein
MLTFFRCSSRASITDVIDGRYLEVALAFFFLAFAFRAFLFSDVGTVFGPGTMQTHLVSNVLASIVQTSDFNLFLAAFQFVNTFIIWAAEAAGERCASRRAFLGRGLFCVAWSPAPACALPEALPACAADRSVNANTMVKIASTFFMCPPLKFF